MTGIEAIVRASFYVPPASKISIKLATWKFFSNAEFEFEVKFFIWSLINWRLWNSKPGRWIRIHDENSIKISGMKTSDAIRRPKFQEPNQLLFLYKIRNQQFRKVCSIEFININFRSPYCKGHFELKNFDAKFVFSDSKDSWVQRLDCKYIWSNKKLYFQNIIKNDENLYFASRRIRNHWATKSIYTKQVGNKF